MQQRMPDLHPIGGFVILIMRKLITVILLAVFLGCESGICARDRHTGTESGPEMRRFEIAVSGAGYPGFCAFGYDFNYQHFGSRPGVLNSGIESIYKSQSIYTKERSSGTWGVSFTYNFTKILALEAGVSYERGWRNTFRKPDPVGLKDPGTAGLLMSESQNYISPAAMLRVSWLNRRIVRMYSSFGAGMAFCVRKDGDVETPGIYVRSLELHPVFQLNLAGISVGKDFYGLAELGFGNLFVGLRLGAGYRF